MARRKSESQATSTKERILEVATDFMQVRGFQGFSYLDVAKAVGVSHVAVHHYFPAKVDLAVAAMAQYTARFEAALAAIAARGEGPASALRAYAGLFEATLRGGKRVCLCGMLTAEIGALPSVLRAQIRHFYEVNERWLAERIRSAAPKARAPEALAATFLAALEGSMLTARAFEEGERLSRTAEWFVASLAASHSSPAKRSTSAK